MRGLFYLSVLFCYLTLNANAQTKARVGPADDMPAAKTSGSEGKGSGEKKTAADTSPQTAPAKGTNGTANPAAQPPGGATTVNASAAVPGGPKNEPKNQARAATPPPASVSSVAAVPLTTIYRVGPGDVLDIRLGNGPTRDSTLYTISAGGLLEYPLAGDPFSVAGMTTDEITARLAAELKRRAVNERAQMRVSVREYVSHTAMISGLVDQPGVKVLRREAVPLFVILAEALPRPDAGRAVLISRATGQSQTVDLADPNALNELVAHGDVINVTARPAEYFYIGGQIGAPGQKSFHPGMTLTQAILASGGVNSNAGDKVRVTVSRQNADGRLNATEYLLKEIESGAIPDPRVQPGDRIEVGRRR